jgi:hypothetical protein
MFASFVAAVGTPSAGTCVPRAASGSRRMSAMTPSAFALLPLRRLCAVGIVTSDCDERA